MSVKILDFETYTDPVSIFFDGVSDFSDVLTRYVNGVVNIIFSRLNSVG